MKALLSQTILATAVFFSMNQVSANTQCLMHVESQDWDSIETVMLVAANGYAFPALEKAQYTLSVDEIRGSWTNYHRSDKARDVAVIASILNKKGEVIFTQNKVSKEFLYEEGVFQTNVANVKAQLIRRLPKCEVLKLKN